MTDTQKYDAYKNNRTELIKEMYDDYTQRYSYSTTEEVYGKEIAESGSRINELRAEMDRNLGRILSAEGFETYYGSYYLKYTNFISYIIVHSLELYIIFICLTTLILFFNCIYLRLKKVMLIIKEKSVICNMNDKKSKEFLIKDIKSIESTWLHGLKIKGNSINLKIYLVKNSDEIKIILMDKLKSF